MNKYLKKIGNGFKALGYYFWNDKIALITGLTTGLSAAAYRIVVGISVAGHDEIGRSPLTGDLGVIGTTDGDLFNSWWNPGFNSGNYVLGDVLNPLTPHDAIIYNTCAGFSGVMIGIGFSIVAFLVGFFVYKALKKTVNLFNVR